MISSIFFVVVSKMRSVVYAISVVSFGNSAIVVSEFSFCVESFEVSSTDFVVSVFGISLVGSVCGKIQFEYRRHLISFFKRSYEIL